LVVGRAMIPPPASQLIIVDHEVVEQCIANAKAKMDKWEGAKADKAIAGDQLHEHYALLDHAQVFSRHASREMQPVLNDGMKIIQQHIATLEQIMTKLDTARQ